MKLGIVGYDVNFIVHFGSEKTLEFVFKIVKMPFNIAART